MTVCVPRSFLTKKPRFSFRTVQILRAQPNSRILRAPKLNSTETTKGQHGKTTLTFAAVIQKWSDYQISTV